jgi:hypothetical protein
MCLGDAPSNRKAKTGPRAAISITTAEEAIEHTIKIVGRYPISIVDNRDRRPGSVAIDHNTYRSSLVNMAEDVGE